MNPRHYYYREFQRDLVQLGLRGGNFPDAPPWANRPGVHIGNLSDHNFWETIRVEHRAHFLHALAYSMLVDSGLYHHFRSAWKEWCQFTAYLDVYSGGGMAGFPHAVPADLFAVSILHAAGISQTDAEDIAPVWSSFIVADLEEGWPQVCIRGGPALRAVRLEVLLAVLRSNAVAMNGVQGEELARRLDERRATAGRAAESGGHQY